MLQSRRTRARQELDKKVEKMTRAYWFTRVGTWIIIFTPIVLTAFDIHMLDVFKEQPIEVTFTLFFMPFVIFANAIEKHMLDIVRLMQKLHAKEDSNS